MVKWYRGEVRYVPARNDDGSIREEEYTAPDGEIKTWTVFTKQIAFEDVGVIKKLANAAQKQKESANLGARFSNRTFANFDKRRAPEAFAQCSLYANRDDLFTAEKNGLLILGTVGTGKTHLAASIANCVVERGIPVQFGTFSDYLESIRQEYDATGIREELSRLKNTMLLVIDDLGKQKRSDWTQQILFDIINHRYEHKLPVVITSNLNLPALEQHAGTAVFSRLYEMCGAVVMTGEDYRKR
jgi:DNA replication protein DnaC